MEICAAGYLVFCVLFTVFFLALTRINREEIN